jgi:hypothetical protein
MGGRLVLIKYVLPTLMVYFSSFFMTSIGIISLIESFLNLFCGVGVREFEKFTTFIEIRFVWIWRLED